MAWVGSSFFLFFKAVAVWFVGIYPAATAAVAVVGRAVAALILVFVVLVARRYCKWRLALDLG